MSLFHTSQLVKTFNNGTKEFEVLKGIDLEIAPGEMIAIMGASGSGKTTLLQVCGTLAQPSSGELFFKEQNLTAMNSQELAHFRNRELGFIFQFHHLLPEFTTIENVMMPALIGGKKKRDVYDWAIELLHQVELDHRIDQRIINLSGGEKQRTALARALIMRPKLLLADEPTGNLDSRAGGLVFELLHRLCREYSLAVIMVTHNIELAEKMDALKILKDGYLQRA